MYPRARILARPSLFVEYLVVGAGGAGDSRGYGVMTMKSGLGGQTPAGTLRMSAGESRLATVGAGAGAADGGSSSFGDVVALGGAYHGGVAESDGSNGLVSSISGTPQVFGSIGGGGRFYDGDRPYEPPAPGGVNAGAGADGEATYTGAGAGNGTPGVDGFGGGGGGGGAYRSGNALVFGVTSGGRGGHGSIWVRYPGSPRATGGQISSITVGGVAYTLHKFLLADTGTNFTVIG